MNLITGLTYGYFIVCFILGWWASGALNYDMLMRRSPAKAGKFLLRLGISLVLAQGFQFLLTYVIGPFLDAIVNQSINGFKAF